MSGEPEDRPVEQQKKPCPNCDGTGTIVEYAVRERNVGSSNTRVVGGDCARCQGTGEVRA